MKPNQTKSSLDRFASRNPCTGRGESEHLLRYVASIGGSLAGEIPKELGERRDHLLEREVFGYARGAQRAGSLRSRRVLEVTQQRSTKREGIAGLHEYSGDSVGNLLAHTSTQRPDDGTAHGHRFENRARPAFVHGGDEIVFCLRERGWTHLHAVTPDAAAAASATEVRDASTSGVLRLDLRPGGYDWEFIPVPGGSFTDKRSGTCH